MRTDKCIVWIQLSNAAFADAGTKLRVSQIGGFVTLGSWSHSTHHLGICYNGVQKVPSITTHHDIDSHFEVRLLIQQVAVSAVVNLCWQSVESDEFTIIIIKHYINIKLFCSLYIDLHVMHLFAGVNANDRCCGEVKQLSAGLQ
jgi:hypothetical protein